MMRSSEGPDPSTPGRHNTNVTPQRRSPSPLYITAMRCINGMIPTPEARRGPHSDLAVRQALADLKQAEATLLTEVPQALLKRPKLTTTFKVQTHNEGYCPPASALPSAMMTIDPSRPLALPFKYDEATRRRHTGHVTSAPVCLALKVPMEPQDDRRKQIAAKREAFLALAPVAPAPAPLLIRYVSPARVVSKSFVPSCAPAPRDPSLPNPRKEVEARRASRSASLAPRPQSRHASPSPRTCHVPACAVGGSVRSNSVGNKAPGSMTPREAVEARKAARMVGHIGHLGRHAGSYRAPSPLHPSAIGSAWREPSPKPAVHVESAPLPLPLPVVLPVLQKAVMTSPSYCVLYKADDTDTVNTSVVPPQDREVATALNFDAVSESSDGEGTGRSRRGRARRVVSPAEGPRPLPPSPVVPQIIFR